MLLKKLDQNIYMWPPTDPEKTRLEKIKNVNKHEILLIKLIGTARLKHYIETLILAVDMQLVKLSPGISIK